MRAEGNYCNPLYTSEWREPFDTGFRGPEQLSHELPLSEETPLHSAAKENLPNSPPPLFHTHYLKRRTMFQFCQSDCHRGLGTWTTMMGLHGEGMTFHTDGFTGLAYVRFRFLTLGAHAQRGLQYLGLSQSHFSGVCSSHKGYHLLNGQ